MTWLKSCRAGKIKLPWLVGAFILITFALALLPAVNTGIVASAMATLESHGYVVLSQSEYTSLSNRIDALKVSADAAAINAQLAVVAAQNAVTEAQRAATKVDLFNSADSFIFPDNSGDYVLFASGDNNTFGAWSEIQDNHGTTLSSKFAVASGYIGDMYLYDLTIADTLWMIKMAYGDNVSSVTSVARIMFNSNYMDLAQIKSGYIPATKKVYYRMMCNTTPTEYVSIGFRYFYE